MAEVGIISRSDDGRFEWIIDDFLSAVSVDSSVESPSFNFENNTCKLEGEFESSHDWVKLGFSVLDGDEYDSHHLERDLPALYVKLGMRTGYKGKQETRSGKLNTFRQFEVTRWMPWSEMVARRLDILSHGRLTVFCELRKQSDTKTSLQKKLQSKKTAEEDSESSDCETSEEEATSKSKSDKRDVEEMEVSDWESPETQTILQLKCMKKMQEDFKKLLVRKDYTDVTIIVKDKQFLAHRNILQVRSPVFKNVFAGFDKVKKTTAVVNISDCDPDTFSDFLSYVYTGNTNHISAKNVFDLYTFSDQYHTYELKEACALFMKSSMNSTMKSSMKSLGTR